ncbi:MAG: tyrosine-type recombinase/integrase [Candidatus Acidiferrales bacterium]
MKGNPCFVKLRRNGRTTATAKYNFKGFPAPRPITSEAQNELYTEVLYNLEHRGHLSAAEENYAELLTVLIRAFEDERYPIRAVSPVEVLAELMAGNNLKQKDLAPLLGMESIVSEVLHGKRKLNKQHIEKLSQRFNVSPALFFSDSHTPVNDPRYRARPTATFAEFVSRWESLVLSQHKPSTRATIRSHLHRHLVPFFGQWQMREIGPEEVQRFVSSITLSAKTTKNLFATIQMLWRSARTWSYVAHDSVSGIVLPRRHRVARRFFSIEEAKRILAAAPEPYRTFYWLAVETGMRAGELCGLHVDDFDFERGLANVRRSVWRGKFQSPKSENAVRSFALSPRLLGHLAGHIRHMRPNENGLLFSTRNGTAWDANLLVKRKLYPLLDSLGIERGGLHAFRHTNSTLMDQLGVPLKVRQQRLGHSDASLTLDVYTHVASGDDARFAEQLDGILHPIAPKSETGSKVEPAKSMYLN